MPAIGLESALSQPSSIVRHYADDQLVTLARLVIDMALQPIVEAGSGHVIGYESLLRGHQKLGFKSPVDLLDHASAIGHLIGLEQLLIERSVAKFGSFQEATAKILFVNFASDLIAEHEIILDRLLLQLRRLKIAPSNICLELSERADNLLQPKFKAFTERLALHGFKLAIDDFGVGHGELRLLSEVPVDYVKIDRHFISGVDKSSRKQSVIRYFVKMAHVLGISVVAEGVETEAELVMCRELGCDLVQGWIVAKPTVDVDQLKTSYAHLQNVGVQKRLSLLSDELLVRREIEMLPTVRDTDSTDAAFKLFREYPLQSYFPVVDSLGMPRGIIQEQKLKYYIYQPYGRDLLRNKSFQRTVGDFVTRAPSASLGSAAELLLDVFATGANNDCLILTENKLYAGVLSATSLLRIINEKQLKSAQEQNPLTGLPGNRSISQYVNEAIGVGDCARYLCYCDFDFFKPFNDLYGFQRGDSAITLFATLMRRYFEGPDIFLGHVGGDDFFIGVCGGRRDHLEVKLKGILDEFRQQVSFYYSDEDREAGFIEGTDRSGNFRSYPLMRCSAAVLQLPVGYSATDSEDVGSAIADLKTRSKSSDSGLVFDVMTISG